MWSTVEGGGWAISPRVTGHLGPDRDSSVKGIARRGSSVNWDIVLESDVSEVRTGPTSETPRCIPRHGECVGLQGEGWSRGSRLRQASGLK